MTSTIQVHFDRGTTAFVTGPKNEIRRRLAVCGDKAPVWVRRRDAWATSTAVASRLLEQLSGRPIDVPDPTPAPKPARPPREQEGLW